MKTETHTKKKLQNKYEVNNSWTLDQVKYNLEKRDMFKIGKYHKRNWITSTKYHND